MNKNIVVGILVLVSIFVLGGLYISSMSKSTSESVVQETVNPTVENVTGRYLEYIDPSTIENNNSKTVLYFYANWCSTCVPADKEFKASYDKLPEGVTVVRVNYNDSDTDANEKALAAKYAITYQHTFVQIDENGNEIAKWNGGSIDKLISNLK